MKLWAQWEYCSFQDRHCRLQDRVAFAASWDTAATEGRISRSRNASAQSEQRVFSEVHWTDRPESAERRVLAIDVEAVLMEDWTRWETRISLTGPGGWGAGAEGCGAGRRNRLLKEAQSADSLWAGLSVDCVGREPVDREGMDFGDESGAMEMEICTRRCTMSLSNRIFRGSFCGPGNATVLPGSEESMGIWA